MGRGGELAAKIQTPSISCVEDRGRPKIHCLRDQVIDGLPHFGRSPTLISALDATRPFPERKWSLPSNSRQGFLTSGSSASLPAFPICNEISGHYHGSYAIAGTQWREPCGIYTRFPCHPLWAPVMVNLDPPGFQVEKAI
jgi:hypothetical protein